MHRTAQLATLALMILTVAAGSAMGAPREAASTWTLKRDVTFRRPKPRKPTLRMQGDKLSGSTGCNSFTATVTRRADQRVAIEEVALTRMLCEPQQNAIEMAFVGALRQTEFITRQGSTLTFLSGEKAPCSCGKDSARPRPGSKRGGERRMCAH